MALYITNGLRAALSSGMVFACSAAGQAWVNGHPPTWWSVMTMYVIIKVQANIKLKLIHDIVLQLTMSYYKRSIKR